MQMNITMIAMRSRQNGRNSACGLGAKRLTPLRATPKRKGATRNKEVARMVQPCGVSALPLQIRRARRMMQDIVKSKDTIGFEEVEMDKT